MFPYLTKQDVLSQLSAVIDSWKEPPFQYPAFIIELDYVKFFQKMMATIRADSKVNFVPVVQKYLEQAFNLTVIEICRALEQNKADGTAIWQLMDQRMLILRHAIVSSPYFRPTAH